VLQVGHIAATTGNDTELDSLIIRLHIETACRRSGAITLGMADLAIDDCLVKLNEKGETVRWQPVSPLLMARLVEHAHSRGGSGSTSRVLRYRNGRAIGYRRYDSLTGRIRQHLPWADQLQISAHWVRHTTLTFVEREFGPAVARAFAGHADHSGYGTTAVYTKASIVEVADALAALTGQPHPLARSIREPLAPWRGQDGSL
jgi:integrase